MKKFGFIGAYDKTDMMMYVAKILVTLEKKVLIIDATMRQKVRYTVPVISPAPIYITEYEGIDVGVGFQNFEQIKQYLHLSQDTQLPYDIVLIDTDNPKIIENFDLKNAERNYFVTAFDTYSLKRGLQTLSAIQEPMKLTKVLFSEYVLKEEDEYLDFLSLDYKVVWDENRIYFPIENGDLSVIAENQRVSKIKLKKLSSSYKEGLIYTVMQILKDEPESKIRKTVKTIERGM